MTYKVSVIIPLYGVEAFVERCAASLMQQTLQEVQYIFVDDAAKDRSVEVLEKTLNKFPHRRADVKVVHHEQNLGLPAARNTGLREAKGEYIFHCDGDDFVEAEMLEQLYAFAKARDLDAVWCDWYLSYAQSERLMNQPAFASAEEAVRAMLSGGMKYNVWNKLIRRSVYERSGVVFPSGYGMGEDMTIIRLFAHCRRVDYLPKAFYHYVKTNASSFCQVYSDRHITELRHNVLTTLADLQRIYGKTMEKEFAFFKLEAKFPFLISDGSNGKYRLWTEWFPEANRYILCNRYVSLRSRIVQWFAAHRLFPLVRFYNWALFEVVYKKLYK